MKSFCLIVGFGLSLVSGAAVPQWQHHYPRAGNGSTTAGTGAAGAGAGAAGAGAAGAGAAGAGAAGAGAIAPGCATGVHMIIARASTEAAGPGVIGGVAKQVMTLVPGSDMESVEYPATLQNYASSEGKGVAGMMKLIEAYTQKCPTSKYALMGYSQGAQVVGDVLGGTSEASQTATPPMPAEMAKNLVAVVQMGDPSHVVGLKQNIGSSTKNGVFPRKDTKSLEPYAPITAAYCDSGDEFCDSGASLATHLGYVQEYGDKAAKFVQNMVQGGGNAAAAAAAPAAAAAKDN